MNQEIFYTDNARNTNFRGNVVIDALCAPDSLQCTNNAAVGGALTVAQNSTFSGDITVSGSRANVIAALVNTQVNGFTSIYFNNTNTGATPTETCQMFSGLGGGLYLCTNTAHSIRLSANRDVAPTTPSIEIAGTGTKAVTISAPLILTSTLTGYSPYWAACKIDGTTNPPTILTRKGDKGGEITCVKKPGQAAGFYDIAWTTAHPDGANWVGMVSGEGNSYTETLNGLGTGYPNTSTTMTAIFRRLYSQPSGALEGVIDCPFTFFILK